MPPLADPDRLRAYIDALQNWRFKGFIRFELTEQSFRWIQRELEDVSLRDIKQLMHEFVAQGGEIDEVREIRAGWSDQFEFHYDLRFTIQDKPVYIETRLFYQVPVVPDSSWILVVNVHEA